MVFPASAERTLFRQLLKISGIGAKLALTILSGASGEELARYVAEGDTASLTRLPGIGKKTAERIIIELRDKLDVLAGRRSTALPAGGATVPASAISEAITALNALGYKPQEVQQPGAESRRTGNERRRNYSPGPAIHGETLNERSRRPHYFTRRQRRGSRG